MSGLTAILVFALVAGWLTAVLLAIWIGRRYLTQGPRGEPMMGLFWHISRFFAWLVHRPTYIGLEHVPDTNKPGGLIVVSNHTGSVDPLLIQAACRFEIRWFMAEDMMIDELHWVWKKLRIIPVARRGADTRALREAIRHVRNGGVLGIFPEGGIVDPPREVRPFHDGVGFLVSRTKAPVLLVWITQTPETTDMMKSLFTPSRARIEFVGILRFDKESDPAKITADLRSRISEVSGWPINDDALPVSEAYPENQSRRTSESMPGHGYVV